MTLGSRKWLATAAEVEAVGLEDAGEDVVAVAVEEVSSATKRIMIDYADEF